MKAVQMAELLDTQKVDKWAQTKESELAEKLECM